jgi:carotenoid cleavage dioxygenase-like enzyme
MLSRRSFIQLAGLGSATLFLPRCGKGRPPEPLPDDPTKAWWLRKDFAPIGESQSMDLEIEGALPPELSGLYLRNGPNPVRGTSSHWFVGDGMVHGTRLSKGSALWYRARYVRTEALGDDGGPALFGHHQANTSVLNYRGRLFCLEEVGLPYEISPADLSTLGTYDFGGKLDTAMTAHPKLDPLTGELLFFAYGLFGPVLSYHRTDRTGALIQSERIQLPAPVMMHDFQITPTHVIFMDLPIVLDVGAVGGSSGLPYKWAPQNGARLGVMPRTGSAADLRWLSIDPCFVFHTWNAFHDRERSDLIHLDGIRYDEIWERDSNDFNTSGRPHRFSIDLSAGTVSLAQLDDRMVELPRIDARHQGTDYRYGYGVSTDAPLGADGSLPPFDRIVKFDHATGTRTAHELAPGQETDEAMFVPHPSASAEDDGWLLAYVFDHADNRSHLRVLDASNLGASPTAKVMLPHRVPHGFHGDFLADV